MDPLVHWFGQYHFIFLHFPLACSVLALVAEILFILTMKEGFAFTVQFLLIIAVLGAIATVLAGLSLAEGRPIPAWSVLWWHRSLGFAILILSILCASIRPWHKMRKWYLCFLVLLAACALVGGDLGGKMTFRHFHWLPPSSSEGK